MYSNTVNPKSNSIVGPQFFECFYINHKPYIKKKNTYRLPRLVRHVKAFSSNVSSVSKLESNCSQFKMIILHKSSGLIPSIRFESRCLQKQKQVINASCSEISFQFMVLFFEKSQKICSDYNNISSGFLYCVHTRHSYDAHPRLFKMHFFLARYV